MENNQQTIHLARAQQVTSTHPGHLDLHPGLQALRKESQKRGRDGNWLMGSETPGWGAHGAGIERKSLCSHLAEIISKQ